MPASILVVGRLASRREVSAAAEIAPRLRQPFGDVDHVRDPGLALPAFRDGAGRVVLGVLQSARSCSGLAAEEADQSLDLAAADHVPDVWYHGE